MSDALFKCPYCGQVFNGLTEDSGAEAECPSCGKVFTLEALDGTPQKLPNAFMCYIGIFKKNTLVSRGVCGEGNFGGRSFFGGWHLWCPRLSTS